MYKEFMLYAIGRNIMKCHRFYLMKLTNTKGKKSRKQLSRRSASKNPDKGILQPEIRVTKGKRQSTGEFRS